jgi:hypothetical protein
MEASSILDLAAGDYLIAQVWQDSGSPLNLEGGSRFAFSLVKLDSGHVGQGVGASAYNSSNLAVSTSGEANLTMDAEAFDTDGFHDTVTNSQRFTIPAGLGGKYLVTVHARPDADPGNSYIIARNSAGAIVLWAVATKVGTYYYYAGSAVLDLVAGDYVEFKQLGSSAANIYSIGSNAYGPWASIMRLDAVSGTPLTSVESLATGNTVLTNSATDYDVVSISLTAGTWLLNWKALYVVGGEVSIYVKLWDKASAIYDEAEDASASNGYRYSIGGHGIATVATTTSVYLTCRRGAEASITVARDGGNGTNHHATKITAVRIA